MDRASVSPGGLVTAALQQEMLILADRPKTVLVPYCSEGWGPVWNKEELILTVGKEFAASGNGNNVFSQTPPKFSHDISEISWQAGTAPPGSSTYILSYYKKK